MLNIRALTNATLRQPSSAPTNQPATFDLTAMPGYVEGKSPGCFTVPLTDRQYHRETLGVSSTMLKHMVRSPAHYRACLNRRHAEADTPGRRFGRAVHCRVLEPTAYDRRYVIWHGPDRRSSAYRHFEAAHPDRCVLTIEEHERVVGCTEALRSSPDFPMRGFLDGRQQTDGQWEVEPARTEFSIFWTDEPTGMLCKVRLDALLLDPLIVLDVKTCGDARPDAFIRDIVSMQYDLQAAFYIEGVRRFTGNANGTWIFAAVEAEAPHAAVFYGLGSGHPLLRSGARKVRNSLDAMAKCEAKGAWPGYGFGQLVEPSPSGQRGGWKQHVAYC